jgi:ketol-acid reductoisomerase
MRVYYGADADMNPIKSKTAAIIGFGTQGHAHALYLCDSGVGKVIVGLRPSSVGVAKAEAAGPEVVDAAEAPKVADEVMVLTPDELLGYLSRQKLHADVKPGAALAFAHGLNVHFNLLTPRPVSKCSWLRQRPRATPCAASTKAPSRSIARYRYRQQLRTPMYVSSTYQLRVDFAFS